MNSSALSAETRKKNCRYFPRKVYALAGPKSQSEWTCNLGRKRYYTINPRRACLKLFALNISSYGVNIILSSSDLQCPSHRPKTRLVDRRLASDEL